MTLKEKFRPHAKYWDCYNDEPLKYDHENKCVKIAEDFAIGFAEFCIQSKVHFFDDTENGKIYLVDLYKTKYMMSELLQIYKNNIYDTKR